MRALCRKMKTDPWQGAANVPMVRESGEVDEAAEIARRTHVHGLGDISKVEHLTIVGCGYVGQLVSRRLTEGRSRSAPRTPASSAEQFDRNGEGVQQAEGIPSEVVGVARQEASLAAIAAAGATPLRCDLDADPLDGIPCDGRLLLHAAPPPADGDRDPRTVRLIEHFFAHGHPRRLVYLSTTGVYGDCDGAWVDETWPLRPTAARSKRRVDAEERLQAWSAASGSELVILRVAGIYAADRLPLERLRQGLPVVKLAQAPWSNRIHAEDLVEVCLAALTRAPAGAIYNVCDGNPSTMTDYFLKVAEAAGLPAPPQIDLAEASTQLSAGMLSYLRESRRLDNKRLRDELGVHLRYPDLAAGLAPLRALAGMEG